MKTNVSTRPTTIARQPRSMLSCAEARTDRTLLDDRLRRRERAGAQQQRQLARFVRLQAGDAEARRQHALNRRGADDFFFGADRAVRVPLQLLAFGQLLLFDVDDGHAPADVVARRLEHLLAAARIELHVDLRLAFREAGGRIASAARRSR